MVKLLVYWFMFTKPRGVTNGSGVCFGHNYIFLVCEKHKYFAVCLRPYIVLHQGAMLLEGDWKYNTD